MSRWKLLKRLSDYFDMGKKKQEKYSSDLKSLLTEIKEKEKKLNKKCVATANGEKRRMLKRKIMVLHAKRKKGLSALKKLKNR